uniref:Sushi domain-containing protein n=1 Tax=Neovison vison TaxID=452646 RepID=A0A8C7AHQ6_NEOVI
MLRMWSKRNTCILSVGKRCLKSEIVIENGFFSEYKFAYPLSNETKYQCKSGYVTPDGKTSGSITCLESGWSPQPTCINSEEKCGPPPRIANGDITSFTLLSYAPGSSVDYMCQSFYVLQGHRTITCRNRQWSPPPKCLEACTVSEDILRTHNIRLRWFHGTKIYTRTGDVIEFECLHGYRTKTPAHTFRAACQHGKVTYPECE